jgi:NAD(P)H-dependent FMN reductase
VLFNKGQDVERHSLQYAFVQCRPGPDEELKAAVDWLSKYTDRYDGCIVTNFDQQKPFLADAPLSYQRLVANEYSREVIRIFRDVTINAQIDQIQQQNIQIGGTRVGNINVGGSANININSTLTNVTQTISAAP